MGSRIAVLAEADDDLSTLSIAAEETMSAPTPQEDLKSGIDASQSLESQAESPPSSKEVAAPQSSSTESKTASTSVKPIKQRYPLYPSVAGLLHEKGIPTSEADKIPASGPKGRLLKGDVLAYLGKISETYSSEQSARITKLGHLDLSKIQLSTPKEPPKETLVQEAGKAPSLPEPEPDTEVAVSISMKSVLDVQRRIQDTLGITMPISTFIARATEVANDDLPRPANYKPSADELFNQVLGLDKVISKTSRGTFTPQMTALPPSLALPRTSSGPPSKSDIIDILTGNRPKAPQSRMGLPTPVKGSDRTNATNIFSVSVSKGEEKRARIFLERVKTILQVEPGRLVI